MDIKLALQWYVPDNWYGSNKRIALVPSKGEFFANKTQANKYLSALKKYVKENCSLPKGVKPLVLCDSPSSGCFDTYRYCSMGPSWSCSEYTIEIKDIEKYIKTK